MEPIWVVVADEGCARILELREQELELEDVEELTDVAAHANRADLRRAVKGRYFSKGTRAVPTAEPYTDELEHEADVFVRRLSDRLAEAQRQHRFRQLRLVAAPRLLGRLRRALDQDVAKTVIGELNKDLIHLDCNELARRLFPAMKKRA